MKRLILPVVIVAISSTGLEAQTPEFRDFLQNGQGMASARIVQMLLLMTVLSVAPGILVTVTCFTRFIIALSFLRSGIGLPSTPANIVLVSLALFMTGFVMAPTLDRMWIEGVQPLVDGHIDEHEASGRIAKPLREFMRANTREKDLRLFKELVERRNRNDGESVDVSDLRLIIPAFMVSELRRGFEIGVLILLPFLVIDIVIATLVMAMGMMMMSPNAIALPFKVMFFVLIDGWNLITAGLVKSFV